MAFVAPVLKKDYDIFSSAYQEKGSRKKKRVEKSHPRTDASKTPKDPNAPATIATDSKVERQSEARKRMEILKQRRMRRYPRKKVEIVLRKISEINEENDVELQFDEMQKGFTKLRRLTEGDESDSEGSIDKTEEKPKEPLPVMVPRAPKKEKKKKTMFGLFYWSPFSSRKKTDPPPKERI